MDRRAALMLGLGGMGACLASAAIGAEAAPLRVYWSTGQLGRSLKATFVDSFSGAGRVDILEGGDNPRFTQMQASRATPNFDVGTFTDIIMPLVVRSGLIAELDGRAIPNLAAVDPGLRPWGAHAVPYAYGSWGIVYNAARVAKPLTSWSDLLRSDLKGRVTAPNITYNSAIYTIDALARLKGGGLTDPEAGLEGMRQVRLSGPGLWEQESIAVGWLKTGEVLATPIYSGNALALLDDPDVKDLRFVVPDEGGYIVPNNLVKLARCPNPDGADRFIDHMLGEPAQSAWPSLGRSRPANARAVVLADVAAATPPAGELRRVDVAWFAQNRTTFVQRWNAVVNR
ncbi:MAG: extracellular solute-binding protein [Rhizobiales bacterium]|nr:extracellular solute-binding protein [Hyphomicrobiales bacterium]